MKCRKGVLEHNESVTAPFCSFFFFSFVGFESVAIFLWRWRGTKLLASAAPTRNAGWRSGTLKGWLISGRQRIHGPTNSLEQVMLVLVWFFGEKAVKYDLVAISFFGAWPRAMHIRHISTLHIKAKQHGHCSSEGNRENGNIGIG